IRGMFLRAPAQINWSLHYMVEAGIDVDASGAWARGRWYLLELARMRRPQTNNFEMVWIIGTYDDCFIVEDGSWKFESIRFDCQLMFPATATIGLDRGGTG